MASFGNVIWFLVIGGLFYFMMRRGGGCCGGHDEGGHGNHGDGANPGEHSSNGQPALLEAANTKDPVCGMQVGENETTISSTYKDRTFRFCSDRCRKLFDVNPNKYAG